MLPVLAVTGMSKEARIASGPGVVAVGAGGSPDRLRELLAARIDPACRAVVSFGIAGGLEPALPPGSVVIATGVVSADGRSSADPVIRATLVGALSDLPVRVIQADLSGVDAAVMSVAAKAALLRATGAAAVDMESHVAAAFARRHGLPFAAIRVICDPAERALPAFAASALTPEGDPDILAVLGALLRGQARIGDLVRLARDSSAAFAALTRCRTRLGASLGLA